MTKFWKELDLLCPLKKNILNWLLTGIQGPIYSPVDVTAILHSSLFTLYIKLLPLSNLNSLKCYVLLARIKFASTYTINNYTCTIILAIYQVSIEKWNSWTVFLRLKLINVFFPIQLNLFGSHSQGLKP